MVDALNQNLHNSSKVGRPCALCPQAQVLVALEYWREYRTYFHISTDWQVSESTICRTVHRVEDALMQSGLFRLPGKKQLMNVPAASNGVSLRDRSHATRLDIAQQSPSDFVLHGRCKQRGIRPKEIQRIWTQTRNSRDGCDRDTD